mmetsp:Transcript_3657/g.9728  ORF Transcript_3657/g.9728 Transcript_3657/m.9728 type:complete len:430 (+) Transcript_3657:906-2195(+)
MLTHAEADVAPFGRGELEVERTAELGQVRRRQVGRAPHKVRDRLADLIENELRRLARRERLVLCRPPREGVTPALGQPAGLAALELGGELRVRLAVLLEHPRPRLLLRPARSLSLPVRSGDVLRDVKEGVLGEPIHLLDVGEVGVAEGCAVHARRARLCRAVPDCRGHLDERRPRELRLGLVNRGLEAHEICVSLLDVDGLPAVRLVALHHVLGEGQLRPAVDLDLVVVVEDDQPAEAEVACEGARLRRDALLHAAVAADDVHVVVEDVEALFVEVGRHVRRRQRETHAVRQALPERARGHLDARADADLRMAGRARIHLTEGAKVIERQVVAGQVQHGVLQRARVAVGEHETVAVHPRRVLRVVLHHLLPEQMCDRRAAHASTRVARVGLLNHVGAEHADEVYLSPLEAVYVDRVAWFLVEVDVAIPR